MKATLRRLWVNRNSYFRSCRGSGWRTGWKGALDWALGSESFHSLLLNSCVILEVKKKKKPLWNQFSHLRDGDTSLFYRVVCENWIKQGMEMLQAKRNVSKDATHLDLGKVTIQLSSCILLKKAQGPHPHIHWMKPNEECRCWAGL